MMDWNGDGKVDYKDDAFYNNVLSDESKQKTSSNATRYQKSAPAHTSSKSNGGVWWFVVLLVYLLIKLI